VILEGVRRRSTMFSHCMVRVLYKGARTNSGDVV
jgi:hypothetical protein